MSTVAAREGHTVLDMDPVRNPYAPGAGQRPPELAGRDTELSAFDVVLERISHGRPERSLVLTGLRGVGKTVLLNQLRSAAISRGWGTGKIEARPEQSLRRPVSSALHMALRELGPRHKDPQSIEEVLGVLKAFALRESADSKVRDRWQPGIDVPAATGRADSGDMEIDLVELLSDAAGVAADIGSGIALFIDEMQDVQPDDVSAICAACHELSQQGAPLIVVGAGLPHLPAVLSASKSYSERLFRYLRIDRLDREAADRALLAPAAREDVGFEPAPLDALYGAADGHPYFVPAYGKVTWGPPAPPRAGGLQLRAARPPRAVRGRRRLPLLRAGLRQGPLGRRRLLPHHRRRRGHGRARRRGRAGRRLLRLPLRPGDPGRARIHARHGGAGGSGGRGGRHVRGRPLAGPQTGLPLPRPRLVDQEGARLLRRARADRLHRPALRSLPPSPPRLTEDPALPHPSRARGGALGGAVVRRPLRRATTVSCRPGSRRDCGACSAAARSSSAPSSPGSARSRPRSSPRSWRSAPACSSPRWPSTSWKRPRRSAACPRRLWASCAARSCISPRIWSSPGAVPGTGSGPVTSSRPRRNSPAVAPPSRSGRCSTASPSPSSSGWACSVAARSASPCWPPSSSPTCPRGCPAPQA